MNKIWIISALNCEAYSFFEDVSFNLRIVTAKICLSLRGNMTKTTKIPHYDWFLLNNRDITDEFTITLRNESDAVQEMSKTITSNDKYENFLHAFMEAAAEFIPTKLRAKYNLPRRH